VDGGGMRVESVECGVEGGGRRVEGGGWRLEAGVLRVSGQSRLHVEVNLFEVRLEVDDPLHQQPALFIDIFKSLLQARASSH